MTDDLRGAIGRARSKGLREALTAAAPKPERTVTPRLVWRGQWRSDRGYKIGDVVYHDGSSWRCIGDHTGSEPPSRLWEFVARKGEKGDPGPQGPSGVGIVGPQGPPGPGGGGGTPASTVESETAFGIAPAVGTGTDYARDDHTHGSPTHDKAIHDALALSHDSMSDVSPNDHHNQQHAIGGADHTGEITDAQHGSRTTANAHPHSTLSGIGPDDHHAKAHIHDGADGSGTVAHSALTGVTANQHHAEDHDHDGSPTQQLTQANTHQSPDTDSAPTALHHTLGTGANQAAAGNHGHVALVPPGTVSMWASTSASLAALVGNSWLVCDGTAVSRAGFASLFAVIGTSYGIGDGSTTFNLPNMVGAFAKGVVTGSAGTTGGAATHDHDLHTDHDAHTDHAAHAHGGTTTAQTNTVQRTATGANTAGVHEHTIPSQAAMAHTAHSAHSAHSTENNEPPWLGLLFIIKT